MNKSIALFYAASLLFLCFAVQSHIWQPSAQEIVRPSERHVATLSTPLKVDLRSYTYRGEVLLYAARMYQGQTTYFQTPGGGFALVLTARNVL
jgi:hypothetical protein